MSEDKNTQAKAADAGDEAPRKTRRELEMEAGKAALAKRQMSAKAEMREQARKPAKGVVTEGPIVEDGQRVDGSGEGVDPNLVNRNPANHPDQALVATANNDPNSGLEASVVNVVERNPVAQVVEDSASPTGSRVIISPDAGVRRDRETPPTGPTGGELTSDPKNSQQARAEKDAIASEHPASLPSKTVEEKAAEGDDDARAAVKEPAKPAVAPTTKQAAKDDSDAKAKQESAAKKALDDKAAKEKAEAEKRRKEQAKDVKASKPAAKDDIDDLLG